MYKKLAAEIAKIYGTRKFKEFKRKNPIIATGIVVELEGKLYKYAFFPS